MEAHVGTLAKHFGHITGPRIDRGKLHELFEIIAIMIFAVIVGYNNFEEVEVFARSHIFWCKIFLNFSNGIPSHDTFERVFQRIDPKEFYEAFSKWTYALAMKLEVVIAIDGQTHRGLKDDGQHTPPLHIVRAWASGAQLVLAQTKIEKKPNKISAIPEILKLLDIRNCIVMINAMCCQQNIAEQMVDKGGDYILALKGKKKHFDTTPTSKYEVHSEVYKDHGQIERREHFVQVLPL